MLRYTVLRNLAHVVMQPGIAGTLLLVGQCEGGQLSAVAISAQMIHADTDLNCLPELLCNE